MDAGIHSIIPKAYTDNNKAIKLQTSITRINDKLK